MTAWCPQRFARRHLPVRLRWSFTRCLFCGAIRDDGTWWPADWWEARR